MNKENKLGRGLGALLSPNSINSDDQNYKLINVSSIEANSEQPRKNFERSELEDLASSIKSQGVLQPIVVRMKGADAYEIIAGERRWRAAQIAGIHEIPSIIKDMDNDEAVQAALIENIQRENLNAVEEAMAYDIILKKQNFNYDSLSKIIGKSKSHISNLLRLLELDKEILDYIVSGKLSMGHARALIGVPNAKEIADDIIKKKLSVRQTEKNTSKYKKNKPKITTKDPNILDLEKELSEKIGLKTLIHFNEKGTSGSLTLYYSNLDQLDNIMKRLKK